MKIKKEFLKNYLHNIAIDQLSHEYASKGYSILREGKIGKYKADLIVEKDGKLIVFEIKTVSLTDAKRKEILSLGDYLKTQNKKYEFKLVVATPPKEKEINIHGVEAILQDYLFENVPDDVMALATHVSVEEVYDVDIDRITIDEDSGEMQIRGDGIIDVELQFGSNGDNERDNGAISSDSFPFDFELILEFDDSGKIVMREVTSLEVDTSSYYGD